MESKVLRYFKAQSENIARSYQQKQNQQEDKSEPEVNRLPLEPIAIYDFDVNDGKSDFPENPRNHPNLSSTDTEHRIFVLSVLAIVVSAIALGFATFKTAKPAFVVVDMNRLLRKKAASIVETQQDPKEEVKILKEARRIREKIDRFAVENKVVVVAKGAVFGGNLREVTDEISAML
jgi:hypothetical protein